LNPFLLLAALFSIFVSIFVVVDLIHVFFYLLYSFVLFSFQIRGSIPLLWSQIQPWKLKPPILYTNNEIQENLQVLKANLLLLYSRYFRASFPLSNLPSPSFPSLPIKSLYLVNLIDKKGSQGRLGSKWLFLLNSWFGTVVTPEKEKSSGFTVKPSENFFSSFSYNDCSSSSSSKREEITCQSFLLSSSSSNISPSLPSSSPDPLSLSMIWFDYHYHMRSLSSSVNSLSQLFTLLKNAFLLNHGFFTVFNPCIPPESEQDKEKERIIVSKQTNLLRTNCMDCLDRTNVIQSYLSRWILFQQIVSLGGKAIHFSSNSLSLPDLVRFVLFSLIVFWRCRNRKQDFEICGRRMEIN
jgi:hypothetical protein